jgi:hypothetical protein
VLPVERHCVSAPDPVGKREVRDMKLEIDFSLWDKRPG